MIICNIWCRNFPGEARDTLTDFYHSQLHLWLFSWTWSDELRQSSAWPLKNSFSVYLGSLCCCIVKAGGLSRLNLPFGQNAQLPRGLKKLQSYCVSTSSFKWTLFWEDMQQYAFNYLSTDMARAFLTRFKTSNTYTYIYNLYQCQKNKMFQHAYFNAYSTTSWQIPFLYRFNEVIVMIRLLNYTHSAHCLTFY